MKKNIIFSAVSCLMLGALSGCSGVHTIHQDTVDQSLNSFKQNITLAKQQAKNNNQALVVPNSVFSALTPNVISHHQNSQSETVFDIKVKDMPIAQFMTSLMQGLGYSVIVSPGLTQKVSLNLKDTTLEKTLSAMHDLYGVQATRTSYGYKVSTVQLETRIFTLNHINLDRSSDTSSSTGDSTLGANSSGSDESSSVKIATKTTTAKFWTTIKTTLQGLITDEPGARVEVNPTSGVVIVTAKPAKLKFIASYLQHTQNIMNRQVVIDAKILEIELSKGFESGISWKNVGLEIDGSKGTYTFKSGLDIHNIDSVVTLLQKEGKVTVLSSPRVVTMNNQHALIEVGNNQYFVTDVSSGTTPVSGSTSTLTSNVSLEPFFSGISLSVLPQINHNGDITLFIHPSITSVTEEKKSITLSVNQKLELPLAKSDVRETDSVVRVKSGQIIVLGGLMQNRAKSDDGGLPGLAAIGATHQNTDSGTVTELVILLKATVPNDKTWINQLKDYQTHYKGILNTYGVSR